MIKATLIGWATALMLTTAAVPAQSASIGVRVAGDVIMANSAANGAASFEKVQSYGSDQLIPPSAAVRSAKSVAPAGSKVLVVKLRNGARPVYVVRLRKGGQVRRIRVDARNGRVLGGY